MTNDMSAYHEDYVREADQNLAMLRVNVDALADDTDNRQALEDARLAAHSLKGISLTMGYNAPASLAADIEAYLVMVLEGSVAVDVGTLRESVAQLAAAVAATSD